VQGYSELSNQSNCSKSTSPPEYMLICINNNRLERSVPAYNSENNTRKLRIERVQLPEILYLYFSGSCSAVSNFVTCK
jgi:hypothetical protein